MFVQIYTKMFLLTNSNRRRIENQVRRALRDSARSIRKVVVRFQEVVDCGVDIACRLTIECNQHGTVRAEGRDLDLNSSLEQALKFGRRKLVATSSRHPICMTHANDPVRRARDVTYRWNQRSHAIAA
jgi:hypothetical protein